MNNDSAIGFANLARRAVFITLALIAYPMMTWVKREKFTITR